MFNLRSCDTEAVFVSSILSSVLSWFRILRPKPPDILFFLNGNGSRMSYSRHKVTSDEATAKLFSQLFLSDGGGACACAKASTSTLWCGCAAAVQEVRYYFWPSIVCFGLDAGAQRSGEKNKTKTKTLSSYVAWYFGYHSLRDNHNGLSFPFFPFHSAARPFL